jgi:hypothetical protein
MGPGTGDGGREETPVPSMATEVEAQTRAGLVTQSLPAIGCSTELNTAFTLRVALKGTGWRVMLPPVSGVKMISTVPNGGFPVNAKLLSPEIEGLFPSLGWPAML